VTAVLDALAAEPALAAVRRAAAELDDDVWVVGGTVRDALLGRALRDVDLAVDGDAERVARAAARALRGPVFRLSDRFGAWRALDRSRRWACDVSPLQGDTLLEDLAHRDFTANAMAIGLQGGELVDPAGGRADLEAGVLRVLGPAAYAADPLRPLRLARLATELALAPDPQTERLTAAAAARVTAASPERVWTELRRLVVAERAAEGLDLAGRLGLLAAVLPELEELRGVGQSHFHHTDAHSHTLEVLRQTIELERDPGVVAGERATSLAAVLDAPLGDELTRGQALRFAALLHDVGKPATRAVRPDGRPTFLGHDRAGAAMVAQICRRLRTGERVRSFLEAVTRHHLVLGFLVHDRPLSRRAIYRYLRGTEPVEVEVTLFSCADRLATRGRNSARAIAAHLDLAGCVLGEALRWRAEGPPRPPLRGDELAAALGLAPGPEIGALLRELEEAAFAGEVSTRDDALELARRVRHNRTR
jgi:poly(A) polymerase